jgi:hypothetical protein
LSIHGEFDYHFQFQFMTQALAICSDLKTHSVCHSKHARHLLALRNRNSILIFLKVWVYRKSSAKD